MTQFILWRFGFFVFLNKAMEIILMKIMPPFKQINLKTNSNYFLLMICIMISINYHLIVNILLICSHIFTVRYYLIDHSWLILFMQTLASLLQIPLVNVKSGS